MVLIGVSSGLLKVTRVMLTAHVMALYKSSAPEGSKTSDLFIVIFITIIMYDTLLKNKKNKNYMKDFNFCVRDNFIYYYFIFILS